ncbi:hypothetical protein HGRIS_004161 [Hohenbuehelia grisea]|uniref:Uncharacterized protein n=1 Tax=Hohenbuehelia grisea TaxID=104357 RepID=A0ABR3JJE6_9AGAR
MNALAISHSLALGPNNNASTQAMHDFSGRRTHTLLLSHSFFEARVLRLDQMTQFIDGTMLDASSKAGPSTMTVFSRITSVGDNLERHRYSSVMLRALDGA